MGSKPGKTDPFKRAEIWLRQRKDARVSQSLSAAATGMLVRTAVHTYLVPNSKCCKLAHAE